MTPETPPVDHDPQPAPLAVPAAARGEFAVIAAREEVIRLVLHRVANERDEPHAHYDAQLEYDDDRLDEAVQQYAAVLGEVRP